DSKCSFRMVRRLSSRGLFSCPSPVLNGGASRGRYNRVTFARETLAGAARAGYRGVQQIPPGRGNPMTPQSLRTSLLACATVCLVAGPVTGEQPEPLAVLGRPAVPHFERVDALALSPDGKTLALAGTGSQAGITLYEVSSGKRLARIDVEHLTSVVFSP